MTIHYASTTRKQSGPGYRLTYFDAHGDPVVSVWAETRAALDASIARLPLLLIS